ncbi:RlpA-like double-psi beta-barrel domain-containing protein [Acidocella sp. MX-AZ02]|uniref:RlpA-like double-psi beta-barrel domain-containing protein n=1 Tax=Acidocella sp. MX-AZ02 TaxID=1214225 RepID=UPI00028DED0E|nr:RlpA-like double-psi beta-barrel domain-containing protein [Acidocella sp. MX-AZ02]EKN00549.1 rare lipoprotein A [Acidocella sp. MX-AZ02]
MSSRLILGLCAFLAGCMPKAPPPPAPGPVTYTIGNPYQVGGEWRYPREFGAYDVTGLGIIIEHGDDPYTADNELYDPDGLMAASPVLPLPSIVTITNLVNGRSLQVRVNERGPNVPGRVIAVTPRVARLLDFPSGGVVEVEVKLNAQASSALQGALGAGPKLQAAPVAGITAQSLGAPGSAGPIGVAHQLVQANDNAPQNTGPTLSGQVIQAQPAPGPLFVQLPGYGRESDAARVMARLYGMPARIVPVFGADRTLWAVNIGPYHSVEDADQALQHVLNAGMTDPEIIVR